MRPLLADLDHFGRAARIYQLKRQLMQKMKASLNVSFEAIAPYDTIAEWL
jgi:hypothetical protein